MGYIIFYQIVGDGIEILRVISGYRNLQDVFNTDWVKAVFMGGGFCEEDFFVLTAEGAESTEKEKR